MEIPNYQPFYIDSIDTLRSEISRLGLDLATDEDFSSLAQPVAIGSCSIANRFCIQPMTCNDAEPDGAPGELTRRRYRRFARGGAGLIWIESTSAGATDGHPAHLALHESSLDAFKAMVSEIREAAQQRWQHDVVLILQLTNAIPISSVAHRLPGNDNAEILQDATIDKLKNALASAAVLAAEAGFDGVDVQACRGALAGTLLSAFTREGAYGGTFANRSRFLRESIGEIRRRAPGLLIATRLCAYDAIRSPHGFGVDASDYRKVDLDEPLQLVKQLHAAGLDLLNPIAATPNLSAPLPQRALQARPDGEPPDEHPLMVLGRQLQVASALRAATPGLKVVGNGFSWLRQFVPTVATAAIADHAIDFVGLGRSALAYPDAPAAVLDADGMQPGASCMLCYACDQLLADAAQVGCPIRDRDAYAAEPLGARKFDPNRLIAEAHRCHLCEAAPCVSASPSKTDIPGFIRAFRNGDDSHAYEIIRASDVLPEMTSQLTPSWLHSEAACIETALNGRPIPILDLHHTISWQARERGETGVRLPEAHSGKKIAVVGGGPAGIAAATRLLEHGHAVDLFESSGLLGGMPERAIPSSRFRGAAAEVDALLAPGLRSGRLRVLLNSSLGDGLELEPLRKDYEAVLIATGLWQEQALAGDDADGSVDALTFLQNVKNGTTTSIPKRVALLAGGDSAMDAAKAAIALGAESLSIVFGAPRAEMHWHLPEDWFDTPGVETMMRCQPRGYAIGADGVLEGLRIHDQERDQDSVLPVDLAIRAMGLECSGLLKAALADLAFTDAGRLIAIDTRYRTSAERVFAAGAIVNGGATVARCVAEGLAAAGEIHQAIMQAQS